MRLALVTVAGVLLAASPCACVAAPRHRGADGDTTTTASAVCTPEMRAAISATPAFQSCAQHTGFSLMETSTTMTANQGAVETSRLCANANCAEMLRLMQARGALACAGHRDASVQCSRALADDDDSHSGDRDGGHRGGRNGGQQSVRNWVGSTVLQPAMTRSPRPPLPPLSVGDGGDGSKDKEDGEVVDPPPPVVDGSDDDDLDGPATEAPEPTTSTPEPTTSTPKPTTSTPKPTPTPTKTKKTNKPSTSSASADGADDDDDDETDDEEDDKTDKKKSKKKKKKDKDEDEDEEEEEEDDDDDADTDTDGDKTSDTSSVKGSSTTTVVTAEGADPNSGELTRAARDDNGVPSTPSSESESRSLPDGAASTAKSSGSGVGSALGTVIGVCAGVVVLVVACAAMYTVRVRRQSQKALQTPGPLFTSTTAYAYAAADSSHAPYTASHRTPMTSHSSVSYARTTSGGMSSLWDDPEIVSMRVPYEKLTFNHLVSRGGFGEVHHGTYHGEAVAIKTLLPDRRRDLQQIENFLSEVKLTASLEHERIVRFIGVAWDSLNELCVVSEFMPRGDLRSVLDDFEADADRSHGLEDADKLKIALHVAHGLVFLHSLQPVVVHRDLKSRNILLDDELNAKLTDFGVSRERAEDHTMTACVGSSLWMAPEVMVGGRYDEKADIFSFGVVLSELDRHVLPYADATEPESKRRLPDTAILQMMTHGGLRVQFSDEEGCEIAQLGLQCVAMDPAARPSASDVLHRLHGAQRRRSSLLRASGECTL